MENKTRKVMRLQNYDYSENGAYFITICTQDKLKSLGTVIGDCNPDVPKNGAQPKVVGYNDVYVKLSQTGIIVKQTIDFLNSNYSNIEIDKYVIMPNHIHLIVVINSNDGTFCKPFPAQNSIRNRTNEKIPKFVSSLKRYTNKQAGLQIWQRSYNDHIIRNKADYERIWNYIDTNPIKWNLDKYYM